MNERRAKAAHRAPNLSCVRWHWVDSASNRGVVMRFRTGLEVLEYEIREEQAATIGRVARELREALDALDKCDRRDPRRASLVDAAAHALWNFVVQRDNAYLPQSIKNFLASPAGLGVTSFTVGRDSPDFAIPHMDAITNNGTVSASVTVQAQAASPSFFVFNGGPYVAATHANGKLIGPTSLFPGATTPAKPAETVVIYANGFGLTSTPIVAGSETQSGTLSPLPAVTIGGLTATVDFAGLNGTPGEFQFNVVVPSTLTSGDQPIVATCNGFTTPPGALI